MRRMMTVLFAAVVFAGTAMPARALYFDRGIGVLNTDKLSMDIWGRGQMLGVGQAIPDPVAAHARVYIFLKQARMGFEGKYQDLFNYEIELAYGGENQNTLQSMAGEYDLMNFVANIPLNKVGLGENTVLKIGQFRVPYGREALTDEGYALFADRSIANMAANQGRDYGLAVQGKKDNWTGTIGTFPGGGRDIAQRYLPENFGFPEIVTRFGYNDGVDEDIYHVMATDRNLKRDTKSAYLNALYTMDTRIGHSTALNSHSLDNNLLVDKNYNPFMNRGDLYNPDGAVTTAICSAVTCARGHLWFVGGDATYRHPLGDGKAVEAEVEANYGGYWNRFGELHIGGGRVSGDYQQGKWTLGMRYAILELDRKAGFITTSGTGANGGTKIAGTSGTGTTYQYAVSANGQPIHELTPTINYDFSGHHMKLIADAPIYINSPTYIDHLDGAYAFPDPTGTDQDTVLTTKGNGAVRRTYFMARMLFQFQF